MRPLCLIVLAATVFLLASCGDGDEKASPSETASDSTTATAVTTHETTTMEQTTVSDANESPEEFFERFLAYEIGRRYGLSWDILHPGHKAIVTRKQYGDCRAERFERFGSVSGELVSFRVLRVYHDPIDAPEIPQKTSKAVVMKFTVRVDAEMQTFTDTAHAVEVGGHWVWLLAPSDVRAFKAGVCPT